MAATVERYLLAGPTDAQIADQIDVDMTAHVNDIVPRATVDVNLSDGSRRSQLDTIMAYYGYTYVETNPAYAGGFAADSTALATDASITNGSGTATLLSVALNMDAAGDIEIQAVASVHASLLLSANVQIALDGTICDQVVFTGALGSTTRNILRANVKAVAAGAHTVALKWSTTAGTLRCNASSNPTTEGANLGAKQIK